MPIRFVCVCGKAHRIQDHMAGKRVRCGKCSAVFMAPGIAAVGPATGQSPDTIRFYCRCGNLQEVPADRAGKRYTCKDCGTIPLVPQASDAEPAAPPAKKRRGSRRVAVVAIAVHLGLAGLGYFLFATDGGGRFLSRLWRDRPLTLEEIVARSEASVALIHGRSTLGSGFLVGPGLLATNAHVIAGEAAGDIEVRFPSAASEARGPFPARVVYRDTALDLALLAVASRLPALPLDDSPSPKPGRDVVIIGCPGVGGMAIENAVSRGVMGPRVGVGSLEFDQVSAAINPGNSGGPVIDTSGKVVGLAARSSPFQQSMAFCIPASEVSAAVARHLAHPDVFVSEGPERQARAEQRRDVVPSSPPDPLASPPVDDPDGTPASRLAACDCGRVLAPDDPRVRRAEAQLATARLLFRQDEEAIARYVIDATAKLRGPSSRHKASEMLATMTDCAPAPETPEARRDAAAYAAAYFRCAGGASTFAETVLAMRRAVAGLEGTPAPREIARADAGRPPLDERFDAPLPREQPRRGRPIQAQVPADLDDPAGRPDGGSRQVFLNRPGSEDRIPIAFAYSNLEALARAGRAEAARFARSPGFFHVDDWTKVAVIQSKSQGMLVKVLEGASDGRQGWVPIGYVRYKDPMKIPGRAATLLRIGKTFQGMGRPKQATTYFEQVVKEYPGSAEAKEAAGEMAGASP